MRLRRHLYCKTASHIFIGTLPQVSLRALPLRYALLKDDFYFLFG